MRLDRCRAVGSIEKYTCTTCEFAIALLEKQYSIMQCNVCKLASTNESSTSHTRQTSIINFRVNSYPDVISWGTNQTRSTSICMRLNRLINRTRYVWIGWSMDGLVTFPLLIRRPWESTLIDGLVYLHTPSVLNFDFFIYCLTTRFIKKTYANIRNEKLWLNYFG